MNAITPSTRAAINQSVEHAPAVLSDDVVARVGVELLYLPNDSIFSAAAPDMWAQGWSVMPQTMDRRPGSVYGYMIKPGASDLNLAHERAAGALRETWLSHCGTLNVACAFGPASGNTFAIDIDVLGEAMSADIAAMADQYLGYSPLRREGRFPKIAIIYRAVAGEKIANVARWISDGEGNASEHGIEIQSVGKMLTFHGRHHETGFSFKWLDMSPQVVGPKFAPEVTADDLEAFFNAVDNKYGLTTIGMKAKSAPGEDKWNADGSFTAGVKATDRRENALFQLVRKVVNSFQADFWEAVDAGEAALAAYRDGKVSELVAKFAEKNELSGRWYRLLIGGEAAGRLSHWIGKISKEPRPAPDKMRKAGAHADATAAFTDQEKKRADAVRRDARKAHDAARRKDDARPVIKLETGDITATVDAAERALMASGLGIYQRGGQIVFVGEAPVKTSDGGETIAKKIIQRGDHALLEDLTASAIWERYDGRTADYVRTNAPMDIVLTLRGRVGRWHLPVLTGFISAPTMRRDGSILDQPGYDAASGLVYDPQGKTFPAIPPAPTKAEAETSLAKLRKLIETFPFVGKVQGVTEATVDEACILAMMLTACVRRNLPTAPLFAISATTPGSGKSKLASIAGVLATGKRPGIVNQAPKVEETEKRIAGFLLSGYPQVAIDNVTTPLDGDLLNSMLTEETVCVRIFGTQNQPEMPTNALVTATGQNISLHGDLTRRAVVSRLDAGVADPAAREFASDPVEDAIAQRSDLVVAALTIMRAYITASRPKQTGRAIGGFEKWASVVRDALMWVGVADPVLSQAVLRSLDPKLDGLNNVFAQWATYFGSERMTVNEVITKATEDLFANGRAEVLRRPLRDALVAVAGNNGNINPNSFGRWLLSNQGRIIDDARIVRCGDKAKVALWKMEFLNGRDPGKSLVEAEDERAARAREKADKQAAWERSESERSALAQAENNAADVPRPAVREQARLNQAWSGGMRAPGARLTERPC